MADEARARKRVSTQDRWSLRPGPFARRGLPALSKPGWSLLVQGVDLHVDAAHALLQRFRWISDARLDDLMVSYASPGGGVGPHVDSYDVFLLQVGGSRRWRVGPVAQPEFVAGLPLRILSAFEPVDEWVLGPGDMLYLPPGWGHDGIAEDACMTCSIGYRAPGMNALARELLQRLGEDLEPAERDTLYRDPPRSATAEPGRVPPALAGFAQRAVARALRDPTALERALGVAMTEPKANVWFERGLERDESAGLRLDRRTRMMYDDQFVYINGEALRAAGRDATSMRALADARTLSAAHCARLSSQARAVVAEWVEQGWVHDD
jgi:50S ribosomal protein L16 3-hydroxylase